MGSPKLTRNGFTGSMVQDSAPWMASPESWEYALNALHKSRDSKGFGLVNEESNELCASFGGRIVGATFIDERNQTLIFTENDELWLLGNDTCKSKFVVSAGEFGCEWNLGACEYHYAELKPQNACNELHAYFSSKCEYFVVNIDEMLDSARKEAIKANFKEIEDANSCEYSCEYFKLFKCVCTPKLSPIVRQKGGHRLQAGAYQFAVQLEDNHGNTSNWSFISEPTYVSGPDNIAGELSSDAISVNISCLDCRYDKVRIAVISNVGNVQDVTILPSQHYNSKGIEFIYYGQQGKTVDLDEITTKHKKYLRGQDLVQEDGRLWLYNIRQERNLHYQPRAWGINVEIQPYEVTAEQQAKYQYRSLMRGERYMFGIVWQYCDGTSSVVFPLSPTGGGGAEGYGNGQEQFRSIDDDPTPPSQPDPENPDIGDGGASENGGGIGSTFNISAFEFIEPEYCRKKGHQTRTEGQDGNVQEYPNSGTTPIPDSDINNQIIEMEIYEQVQAWATDLKDYEDSTKCDDCKECYCPDFERDEDGNPIFPEDCCTGCCEGGDCSGCFEDTEAVNSDGPRFEEVVDTWLDNVSELANEKMIKPDEVDSRCPDIPETDAHPTSSLKAAAEQLIRIGVNEAEYFEPLKGRLIGATKSQTTPSGAQETVISARVTGEDGSYSGDDGTVRGHQYTDCNGHNLTEESPRALSPMSFIPYFTADTIYPDTIDCGGNPLWGSKANSNVELFEVPGEDVLPCFRGFQDSAVGPWTKDGDELSNGYVILLGLKVSGIPIPDPEELPKPLCPTQPYRIVMIPRDHINKRVAAKGLATSTFIGNVRGAAHAVPRHGVNSMETIDAHIDDNGSRLGSGNAPGYNFHSLDTSMQSIMLDVDTVVAERFRSGNGSRHGLYAIGRDPEDSYNGSRVDQRGARTSINLNMSTAAGAEQNVNGITYAPANSVVTNPLGITYPLLNMMRESSVYFEPGGSLPGLPYNLGKGGGQADVSFVGDGMQHAVPVTHASAWYVSLRRNVPNQYGDIAGARFIDTGLVAGKNNRNQIAGICGDIFIGPHSFKRTGYVSNKVGDFHDTARGPRTVCDPPDDKIFQQLGQWFHTKLPIDRDLTDAKNYCSLHRGKDWQDSRAADGPEEEYYYPRTQSTLITYWGEFEVNPYKRATGKGDPQQTGEVYYPKLKGLHLDSNAPTQQPWEDSWMNRFYCRVQQPSLRAKALKVLIRTALDIILPAIGVSQVINMEGVPDITGGFFVAPILIALWWFANRVLFREDRIDNMLGIPRCKTDSEGGEMEDCVTGFEDNYYSYSMDFNKQNDENIWFSMNDLYNTCDCDDCELGQTTNEVFYSNKQLLGSDIDAYRNFQSEAFVEIPAHAGQLKKMFKFNGQFFAHTTEGLHIIKYQPKNIDNASGFSYLGGDLLIRPFQLLEGVPEGFAGISDPNSAILTKFGYFFVDNEARKVYHYNGTGIPKDITTQGMELFFKQSLDFCDKVSCRDEKTPGGMYYSLGYDPRYDRILLTKKDGSGCNSFTISYSPEINQGKGGWVSFHSYMPQAYLWDRHDMYSIVGSEVWKHNVAGSYQTFYGDYNPHLIQFTAIPSAKGLQMKPFTYERTTLRTEVEKASGGDYIRDIDDTFNKMAMFNHTQGTGTVWLERIGDNFGDDENQRNKLMEKEASIRAQKNHREWDINQAQDYKLIDCRRDPSVVRDCECQAIPNINENVYDCKVPITNNHFRNKNLSDDHLTYRFIKDDNKSDQRIKTIYVETYGNSTEKED
jgi:hypothetical protein